MKKITKLLSVFLLAGTVGTTAAAFGVSCAHKHSYEGEWTRDENVHYHASTCGHGNADYGEHVYGDDNVSDVCEYVKPTGEVKPPVGEDPGDDDPVDEKMSEADFKAAIDATLAATNYTFTANGESAKFDATKKVCAAPDGTYMVYDETAKAIVLYSPYGGFAWEKVTLKTNVADLTAAKEIMTVDIPEVLNLFKAADYSTITLGENGKYMLGKSYITFDGGKVSGFGATELEGVEDISMEISSYGTTEVTLPDTTLAFENIVYATTAKNAVGTKLAVNENSMFGLFADEEMTTATDYIEATANGYKQTVTVAASNNKGAIVSVSKLEGKIEGYFEFSLDKVGSKNDMLSLRSGGVKVLSLRTGDDSKKLTFRKKVGDGDTAKFSDISGLTPVAATVYKVSYTFVKDATSGNYKADITINGVAFASNEDLGVSTLDGFTIGCSNAKVGTNNSPVKDNVRLVTIDNVIICGTPAEGVQLVKDITLDKNEIRIEEIGKTATLTATTDPANAKLIWTTSDASVATVKDGVVTAVGKGTAKISAITENGKMAQCTVNVGEKPKPQYTVTFKSDNTTVATETVTQGDKVKQPTGVTKEGYTLKGWAIGSVNGAIFDFNATPIESSLTLHAVWEKGATTPVDPTPVKPGPSASGAEHDPGPPRPHAERSGE